MDFKTFVTERLAYLTANYNAIGTNAKKIDELPVQINLDPASKIHVSRGGDSESLEVQEIINSINNNTYNQLLSIGEITLVDNVVTIPADARAQISQINYNTVAITTIPIPYAAAGLTRTDILVFNTSSLIVRVPGNETAGIAVRPNIPINTVLVTEINVTELAIGDPTPPVTLEALATKLDKDGYSGTAKTLDDRISAIEFPDEILIRGEAPLTGDTINIAALAFTVRINQNEITNPLAYSTVINPASEGYNRTDIITINESGVFAKIEGVESVDIAVKPEPLANTLEVVSIDITGAIVADPVEPINPGDSILKSEQKYTPINLSGVLLKVGKKSSDTAINFIGAATVVGSLEVKPQYFNRLFDGVIYTIKNSQSVDIVFNHLSGTGNVLFSFPTATNFTLKPNEIFQCKLRITGGNTAVFDYIGVASGVGLPIDITDVTGLATELDSKLDAADYNNHFKGVYLTESALITANPTAIVGDYAQVNETGATDVANYSWDSEESIWAKTGSTSSGATNTDALPEGTTNLYFTVARFLANLTYANVISALGFTPSTAPNDAQKNSNITKAEIEAKLTGEITSHTHPSMGSENNSYSKNTSSRVDLSLVSSTNALSPLTIPTSDGSGEAVHPSVLYFKEKWNNYHYWMVITPYNNSDSELENPEIVVSNDGITWVVPAGVTNPLVPSPINGYSADTELVYNTDTNTMWIVYRATINAIDYVKVMSSTNGVTWTAPVDILSSSTFYYASPAVIYEKGIYTLWWVEVYFNLATPRVLKYKTSTDMLSGWSETTSCTVVFPSGKDLWHLSMRKVNEEYHAFMHVGTAGTDSAIGHELYFATSLDNITYKLTSSPIIRQGQDANFDKDSIYRGSAIYFPNANKYVFYYSANTLTGGIRKWRISYTDVFLDKPKVNNFSIISTSQKLHAIHNEQILKIKANVTITVPFQKLQDDFNCYFDVFTGFTLTFVFESGNTVSGNASFVLNENKMAMLYRDGNTNSFRLKGDI